MKTVFLTAADAARLSGSHPIAAKRLEELRAYADKKVAAWAASGETRILDLMDGFKGGITQSEANSLVSSLKASGFDVSGTYRRGQHDHDVLPHAHVDIYW